MITEDEWPHLVRCVDLAEEALDAGDEPFGSVLVDADGTELFAARNEAVTGDATRHPEFAVARWAAENLTEDERRESTVYTSGEHCPMCAAAHGWARLGRIVYATSSEQYSQWLDEFDAPRSPVAALPITEIVSDIAVDGPVPGLVERVHAMQAVRFTHAST